MLGIYKNILLSNSQKELDLISKIALNTFHKSLVRLEGAKTLGHF
jgi:hypothetical protein